MGFEANLSRRAVRRNCSQKPDDIKASPSSLPPPPRAPHTNEKVSVSPSDYAIGIGLYSNKIYATVSLHADQNKP